MTDGAVILLALAVAYFLPSLIAGVRGQPNTMAIFALNLFLGWTLLGWVIALVWSLSSSGQPTVTNQIVIGHPNAPQPKPEKQKRCLACAEWILKDARKCKHCGEMQADHLPGLKTVTATRPAVLEAPHQVVEKPAPEANQSISIANWTSKLPSARGPGIDWESVDHPDRNRGRSG